MTTIVHTGYTFDLSQEILDRIAKLSLLPIDVSETCICAVHHAPKHPWTGTLLKTNESTMRQWYDKNVKKEFVAYVVKIHYGFTYNAKKTKILTGHVVLHVTIDGKPYYVNLYNKGDMTAIRVKQALCRTPDWLNTSSFENKLMLSCSVYIKTQ